MSAHRLFLAVFFSLLVALNLLVGAYLISSHHALSVIYLLIMQLFNIGVAYGLTQLLLSLLSPKEALPHLQELSDHPAVALLYTTCDDLIPELLRRLRHQTYVNAEVFVLDDSTDEEYKHRVVQIAAECGFRVLRRGTREGYKAGNLNHWLALYGDRYKYFVVLDSDSALEDDFVERMVRYAEHPANAAVAVFQSKIRAWNTQDTIPRILDRMAPLYFYQQDRLANRFGYISCWGHNCLFHTAPIREVGGFDERFVSEDYATALNLIDHGYSCKLVDLVSYEAIPDTAENYTRRAVRWAKQSLELELYKSGGRNVPFLSKLHLFMNTYSFAIWYIFLAGIVLATWGYRSSPGDLAVFMRFMLNGGIFSSSFKWPLLIVVVYYFYFTLLRLPLAIKLGVGAGDYFKYLFLTWSLGFAMMIPLIVAQTKVLLGERPCFTATRSFSRRSRPGPLEEIKRMRATLLFILFIAAGIMWNPLSLGLNFPWVIPLVLAPLTSYLISTSRSRTEWVYAPRGERETPI